MVTVEIPSSLSISKVPTESQVSDENAAPCNNKIALMGSIIKALLSKGLKPVRSNGNEPRSGMKPLQLVELISNHHLEK